MRRPGGGRFEPDWLALRATYDERARDEALLPLFAEALSGASGELRFTDLASGTAGNFLYLAPRLAALRPSDQRWRLVDYDSRVLDRASARIGELADASGWGLEADGDDLVVHAGDMRWTVMFRRLDLARDLEAMRLEEGEAVVLSALLDLVSPAWMQRFVDWARAAGSPILATLTYNGALDWRPPDPDDDRMRALFNDHQRRDKGFGPALGPSAPSWIATRLIAAGYRIEQSTSPWRLGPEDLAMLNALIETIAASAAEQDPQARRFVAGWSLRRSTQGGDGLLSAEIGHADLVARP